MLLYHTQQHAHVHVLLTQQTLTRWFCTGLFPVRIRLHPLCRHGDSLSRENTLCGCRQDGAVFVLGTHAVSVGAALLMEQTLLRHLHQLWVIDTALGRETQRAHHLEVLLAKTLGRHSVAFAEERAVADSLELCVPLGDRVEGFDAR